MKLRFIPTVPVILSGVANREAGGNAVEGAHTSKVARTDLARDFLIRTVQNASSSM
jgi:hypothetical protein